EDEFSRSAFFTPANHRLMTSSRRDGLAAFDLQTGERTTPIPIDVFPVDLSPDGRTLLCTTEKQGLRLFDLVQNRVTASSPEPGGRYRRSAHVIPRFSPDGSYVLSWTWEQLTDPTWVAKTYAVIRDPNTLEVKREFDSGESSSTAVSPDGLWLALG